MKKLIALILLLPLVLVLLLTLAMGIAMQRGLVSKSDIAFLLDLRQRDGLTAVVSTVRTHLYGADPSLTADPSYGRKPVEGRGYAPWVIRGNLDGRPRVLKFALGPQLWVAYDTQTLSLYQAWQGDILFEGAVYDYRHGPQPVSTGAWFLRDSDGAQWFLLVDGQELPATVQYLGHEYSKDRKTAALRFAVTAGAYRLELTEKPEIIERGGARYLTRSFYSSQEVPAIKAGFRTGQGDRYLAAGTLEILLGTATPITDHASSTRGLEASEDELEQGKSIISNSDCLGCHAANHRVTGPAWAQIAGKFRGMAQEEVVSALARSVREGNVGIWGQVPMPAHPQLTQAQAMAAITYVLSVDEEEANLNVPQDATGRPYTSTRDYDVLPRLNALHPSFRLENLAPEGFQPKVGGMAFRDDGKLVIASWDADGAVFLLDPNAPEGHRVQRIAEGLHEPLGLTIVNNRIFVLQKQELTELIDNDGDELIDYYRAVSSDWSSGSNFHSFAFGLLHRDDAFYFLLSICVLPGGASCPEQLPTQGKLMRVDSDGKAKIVASGFRTPNGIANGPDGAIYVTDNQGDWLPASKIVEIRQGEFYGSRAVPDEGVMARQETPPAIWLPQDEVGNSPTQPLLLEEGPYTGQLIHGDVYNGGVKRVFLEDVGGRKQGAVFHFSAGFGGGVNRLERGPDGAIYIGEVGNPPNWGEYDKLWFGLERMSWVGNKAFEILSVKAQEDGFIIELTQPLTPGFELTTDDLTVKQWLYYPNEQYGGPKYDETILFAGQLEISQDRRNIHARIPGLKAGYVVYLRLHDRLRSEAGNALWTAEAWYTLNAIPGGAKSVPPNNVSKDGWRNLFDGHTLAGWRNYGGDKNTIGKWKVEDGALTLVQDVPFPMWDLIKSVVFGGPSGDLIYYREKFRDFELSLQWKISNNGNSGIFYLVRDEIENTPWLTGIEMQVLDNEGHADGQIETHRAGDLYDLIAANPETVRPPGEWNDVLLRIKDNHIEHWLNGVMVVSVERGSDEWSALVAGSKFSDMPDFGRSEEGYIVLQDHGDPVWYRNIRIREL